MKKEAHGFSETSQMNKTAITCYITEITIISIAYFIEVLKHNRSIGYFLLVFFTLWIPAVLTLLWNHKDPDAKPIRYLFCLGFAVPQAIMMFTAQNNLVFTYAILIMIVAMVYSDLKYALIVSVVYNMINIASVVFLFMKNGFSNDLVVSSEIQVLLLIITGTFAYFSAKAGLKISQKKLEQLNEEKQNVTRMLGQIVEVSQDMTTSIAQMNDKMEQLGALVEQTADAMQEVRAGSNETAESIQTQLVMTEEIQSRIDEVSDNAQKIAGSVEQTNHAIAMGTENMDKLTELVADSEKTGEQAIDKLHELEEYAQKMQTIVELINAVADQTGLLSLNASIEAARAGEAGKGFAVVASEISNLAGQTQQATEDIDELINGVVARLQDAGSAINALVDGNRLQKDVAQETSDSLSRIQKDSVIIEQNTDAMTELVHRLESANHSIVESIQNISAITEEVSAHSNETYDSSVRNTEIVKEVGEIAQFLQKRAEELQS